MLKLAAIDMRNKDKLASRINYLEKVEKARVLRAKRLKDFCGIVKTKAPI